MNKYITRTEIERDDDYLGTGNYFLTLYGRDEAQEEYIIDTEEFNSINALNLYLNNLKRWMMDKSKVLAILKTVDNPNGFHIRKSNVLNIFREIQEIFIEELLYDFDDFKSLEIIQEKGEWATQ